MVRHPLTPEERERGRRLGSLLRTARGNRTLAAIAERAGLPSETLRKIEAGRIAGPSFFTVAAIAGALGLSLDRVVALCALPGADPLPQPAAVTWAWSDDPPSPATAGSVRRRA
ncbi:helix-turn-helix transcriptional regulator [Actinokineospora sp. PR83]|uniref:helix-turn-helix domain-containing protein n=1 Tax=Actinokineospora sp. PR83 TaxID=2884908 RepID=UPI001F22A600|nr:helix-turn-helix transcriptional regulator [Actinokineospora sp. PR83]MCG8920760.1 helix-turn-helix transcriptional regulator [Actinokineospora sp. PR83]